MTYYTESVNCCLLQVASINHNARASAYMYMYMYVYTVHVMHMYMYLWLLHDFRFNHAQIHVHGHSGSCICGKYYKQEITQHFLLHVNVQHDTHVHVVNNSAESA